MTNPNYHPPLGWHRCPSGLADRYVRADYPGRYVARLTPEDRTHRGQKKRTWFARIIQMSEDKVHSIACSSGFPNKQAAMQWCDEWIEDRP